MRVPLREMMLLVELQETVLLVQQQQVTLCIKYLSDFDGELLNRLGHYLIWAQFL